MPEPSRRLRGLIDTSVLIDLDQVDERELPSELAISAVSMAELAAGPHATDDPIERSNRQEQLQHAEALFEAIPFDDRAARAYGRVYAAFVAVGQKPRGPRAMDLMIAATALAAGLPLYTRNPGDFSALGGLLEVLAV